MCSKLGEISSEAKYWQYVEKEVPASATRILEMERTIKIIYKNVENLVIDYNTIITCK